MKPFKWFALLALATLFPLLIMSPVVSTPMYVVFTKTAICEPATEFNQVWVDSAASSCWYCVCYFGLPRLVVKNEPVSSLAMASHHQLGLQISQQIIIFGL